MLPARCESVLVPAGLPIEGQARHLQSSDPYRCPFPCGHSRLKLGSGFGSSVQPPVSEHSEILNWWSHVCRPSLHFLWSTLPTPRPCDPNLHPPNPKAQSLSQVRQSIADALKASPPGAHDMVSGAFCATAHSWSVVLGRCKLHVEDLFRHKCPNFSSDHLRRLGTCHLVGLLWLQWCSTKIKVSVIPTATIITSTCPTSPSPSRSR